MVRSRASLSDHRLVPSDLPRRQMHDRLKAYLETRETLRRLKASSAPCFARDWKPKSG